MSSINRVETIVDLARWAWDKGGISDLENFFLIAWDLWYRRNKKMFEEKDLLPEQVIVHALSLQKGFHDMRCLPNKPSNLFCSWSPPQEGVLKLNVDGAIFDAQHCAGVGVVLRDEGKVILVASRKDQEVNDPIEIELIAIFSGLQLCMHMGITHLVVETY
ncbi:uncharacterized protein LOC122274586 [Carya illinoinensis]|uniref:uncharacterized protein LOC122274586 n=1 Tax=Carya illinoinensis TaxID=32201 RepID=UPI001C725866|nr:uncharacterized protein LOC122274586 [Carya illinoinensis]